MVDEAVSLEDKFTRSAGRVFLTGLQALVRLPMAQIRRDRAAGLNTAGFISGYRGSPLGGYDQQLAKAQAASRRPRHRLPAGRQRGPRGVRGLGQPAAPALARRRATTAWSASGTARGRASTARATCSSTATPPAPRGTAACCASPATTMAPSRRRSRTSRDHAFMSALMPVLYPSSIHEFIGMGLLGIAMSRYSGCWVGMKLISDTVETTAAVDLARRGPRVRHPGRLRAAAGRPQPALAGRPLVAGPPAAELQGLRRDRLRPRERRRPHRCSTARARGSASSPRARPTRTCARRCASSGSTPRPRPRIGLRVYKVGMPWPIEPENLRHFCEGLDEVLVVEERREIIENQIKQ